MIFLESPNSVSIKNWLGTDLDIIWFRGSMAPWIKLKYASPHIHDISGKDLLKQTYFECTYGVHQRVDIKWSKGIMWWY